MADAREEGAVNFAMSTEEKTTGQIAVEIVTKGENENTGRSEYSISNDLVGHILDE